MTESESASEKAVSKPVDVDIRLCKDCRATLFNRRDFENDKMKKRPDVKAYENLVQFERGIRQLLPRFQKLLTALQYVWPVPTIKSILMVESFTGILTSLRPLPKSTKHRKFVNGLSTLSRSMTRRLDEYEICRRSPLHNRDCRRQFTSEPVTSSICTCYH